MMTEQELYDELTQYYRKRTDNEIAEGRPCFLLVFAAENETTTSVGAAVIDPEVPSKINGPPYMLDIAQQTLIYLHKERGLYKELENAQQIAVALSQAYQALGDKRMKQIIATASNAEEFSNFLSRALKQAEVEKHGTG